MNQYIKRTVFLFAFCILVFFSAKAQVLIHESFNYPESTVNTLQQQSNGSWVRVVNPDESATPVTYYVDSNDGNDANNGTSETGAFKTLAKIQDVRLHPGDIVRFKRGSAYTGPLYITDSGKPGAYITLTDYGNAGDPAPSFTNPVFAEGNFGNCVRVKGSYVKVENLYCHNTSAYVAGSYSSGGGFLTVWEMGAIYIDKSAENCIVSNNEIYDCVVGVKSYGKNTLIEHNYIHDCSRVLAQWNWGPIGIWFGGDYQEARYNKIFNYRAEDPRINWGGDAGGADGGAFEIDDARYDKANISIHHNYTRDCQGFLEVTWTDVLQHPAYVNFQIHHNLSDDYQQFIALWAGAGCKIDNNTIIRRKKNSNDWGVFNITQNQSRNKIRNNIIVTEQDIPIFNVGLDSDHTPQNIIQNNLYYAASGTLVIGKEGPGDTPVYGNPLFVNYNGTQAEDYAITTGSPAIDQGQNLGFTSDFINTAIPNGSAPDIGAFEFIH
ncbi:hypothetical protein FW774_00045 (plasmid) [Pedobacter sp. BS3]|uniref:choice-of-anchor Q domain-containing protein n=1 Tax=Pedobacter sp. BS3 TaxID=2567937 RepID=UPI0011EF9D44|nr:choice-of-anchor Q domain-containing protein [Pedobacter sp. BS3]TZF85509.1 hypothetical protein FW774_00045 [Pedobacter sp. BS3]